ncbi:MAG: hypothetical protein M1833_006796 [Piccolia ochrophora]|nr:MAG: hypothetical protein M1833_006796 [Piccolia ochrophora]
MLLTSGQISMTISSCVVFLFTSLLFFSGYVLQQQTVRNIQAALGPIKPVARTSHSLPTQQPTSDVHLPGSTAPIAAARKKGRPDRAGAPVTVDWTSLAYAQLISSPSHVCNAVMLFAELHHLGSRAGRVLLYPNAWDLRPAGQDGGRVGATEHVRTLLEMAAEKYDVVLRAVEPLLDDADVHLPSSYPLPLLFTLTDYDQVMHLSPSGLLLNSSTLDGLLSEPIATSLAALPAPRSSPSTPSSILVVRPSAADYHDMKSLFASESFHTDIELLRTHYAGQGTVLAPKDEITLVLETSSLQRVSAHFQATAVYASTSYVHFSDSMLPGPEFAVGRDDLLQAKPKDFEAGRVWQSVYDRFRQERRDVCGLDLDVWDGNPSEGSNPSEVARDPQAGVELKARSFVGRDTH